MKKVAHPEWNEGRKAFAAFRATWSPGRKKEDQKLLRRIFAAATKSPTAKAWLDWARANGVRFFVDHTCINVGAYYLTGTGVIGIPLNIEQRWRPMITDIVTHEIRHAWQDSRGFIETPQRPSGEISDFNSAFIKTALIEADAWAVGKAAEKEAVFLSENSQAPSEFLKRSFMSWFTPWILQFYGDPKSKAIGHSFGLYDGEIPNKKIEFIFECSPRPETDITHIGEVLKRGEILSGENYFHLMKKELREKVLRPLLAETFYGAANEEQRALTRKLRYAAARHTRRQNPDSPKNHDK